MIRLECTRASTSICGRDKPRAKPFPPGRTSHLPRSRRSVTPLSSLRALHREQPRMLQLTRANIPQSPASHAGPSCVGRGGKAEDGEGVAVPRSREAGPCAPH
ncbi:hypothetical protein C2E23DRAFT_822327 [Lenzites betulinus]|nr:hypothetical protein C2E23DRAFT_822327 [Lenzites betulinus]